MSATNQTAVYGLPIFLGTDVPSWLTDWNGAMGDIDTAIAAAKAAADAAASTAGTAATDIVTINGQITSLQNTVGTHTTQIGTITGNINTINSLIGNGTPTTTDQTIIGAINELHADQGDLADLTTTDKSSLVAAINEAAQGGGGGTAASVSYNNTGSGLTATNVQDAIDELAGSAAGSVSVTTDGTKTRNQMLDSLFALVDMSKVTRNTQYVEQSSGGLSIYNLVETASNSLNFYRLGKSSSDCDIYRAEIAASSSVSRMRMATGGTISNDTAPGTAVPTAGITMTIYY